MATLPLDAIWQVNWNYELSAVKKEQQPKLYFEITTSCLLIAMLIYSSCSFHLPLHMELDLQLQCLIKLQFVKIPKSSHLADFEFVHSFHSGVQNLVLIPV